MNLSKAFEEKKGICASSREKDPSLKSMVELLTLISKMRGKQRSYCINEYMNLYSHKFSAPTAVNRNGTKIWNLFSKVSNRVLNEGDSISDFDSKVISSVLDVGQRCTVEGIVVPSIPDDIKEEYARLTAEYKSGKFASEVQEAAAEINMVLS